MKKNVSENIKIKSVQKLKQNGRIMGKGARTTLIRPLTRNPMGTYLKILHVHSRTSTWNFQVSAHRISGKRSYRRRSRTLTQYWTIFEIFAPMFFVWALFDCRNFQVLVGGPNRGALWAWGRAAACKRVGRAVRSRVRSARTNQHAPLLFQPVQLHRLHKYSRLAQTHLFQIFIQISRW